MSNPLVVDSASGDAGDRIADWLLDTWPENRDLCVLCVGTPASVGDALGPWVGDAIYTHVPTVGTLGNPVHADNLHRFLPLDARNFNLVVDAMVSPEVGRIYGYRHGIIPGSGVGRTLSRVGDAAICPVVAAPTGLHTASYRFVYGVARTVADAILAAVGRRSDKHTSA